MGNITGERIVELRKEKGLTQAELAARMHVKRETVFQWEAGIRQIKSEAIKALSAEFGVTSDYILGISDYRTPKTAGTTAENMGISEDAATVLLKLASAPAGSQEDEVNRQTLNFINRALSAAKDVHILALDGEDSTPCLTTIFQDMEKYIHSEEYRISTFGGLGDTTNGKVAIFKDNLGQMIDAAYVPKLFRESLISSIRYQLDEWREKESPLEP